MYDSFIGAVVVVSTKAAEAEEVVLRELFERANPVMGRSLGAFACREDDDEKAGTRSAPDRDTTLAVADPRTLCLLLPSP